MVGILQKVLVKQVLDLNAKNQSLHHEVYALLSIYRDMPHTLTRIIPAEIFKGRGEASYYHCT
jgi:hypothetical protein